MTSLGGQHGTNLGPDSSPKILPLPLYIYFLSSKQVNSPSCSFSIFKSGGNIYYCKPAMSQSLCINTLTILSRLLSTFLKGKYCYYHFKIGNTVAQKVSGLHTITRLGVSAVIKMYNFKWTTSFLLSKARWRE